MLGGAHHSIELFNCLQLSRLTIGNVLMFSASKRQHACPKLATAWLYQHFAGGNELRSSCCQNSECCVHKAMQLSFVGYFTISQRQSQNRCKSLTNIADLTASSQLDHSDAWHQSTILGLCTHDSSPELVGTFVLAGWADCAASLLHKVYSYPNVYSYEGPIRAQTGTWDNLQMALNSVANSPADISTNLKEQDLVNSPDAAQFTD